jgi:hypothetical protein
MTEEWPDIGGEFIVDRKSVCCRVDGTLTEKLFEKLVALLASSD